MIGLGMPGDGFKRGFEKRAKLKKDVKLKPHQKRVRDRLSKDTDSLLLYHGLGAGKTLSSIAATSGLDTDVVVPAALRPNYAKEVSKYTTKTKNEKRKIISYARAAKGLTGGDALVLDEVQRINNPATARAVEIMGSAAKYKKRVLLSGTPIRNHPHEIAPIIRVLDPENRDVPLDGKSFRDKFLDERKVSPGFINILRGIKPGVEYSPKNLKTIRKAIEGKIDYYMPKSEGYPSKSESVTLVPMSPEQSKVYAYVTGKANPAIALKVKKNLPLSKSEASSLNAFMSAARIVSNTTKPFGGTGDTPKMIRAASDLKRGMKNNPNFKALAYSNYLDGGVKEYSRILDKKNVSNVLFTGEMSDKEKKKAVEEFNKGKKKALLISGAGAEGLDLKGTRMVQILEPHWNKARVDQAIGRAIRYKSHDHLPEKDRHVSVNHYHSQNPPTGLAKVISKMFKKKPPVSADTYLHDLSIKKDELNQKFLEVLKREGQAKSEEYESGGKTKKD